MADFWLAMIDQLENDLRFVQLLSPGGWGPFFQSHREAAEALRHVGHETDLVFYITPQGRLARFSWYIYTAADVFVKGYSLDFGAAAVDTWRFWEIRYSAHAPEVTTTEMVLAWGFEREESYLNRIIIWDQPSVIITSDWHPHTGFFTITRETFNRVLRTDRSIRHYYGHFLPTGNGFTLQFNNRHDAETRNVYEVGIIAGTGRDFTRSSRPPYTNVYDNKGQGWERLQDLLAAINLIL